MKNKLFVGILLTSILLAGCNGGGGGGTQAPTTEVTSTTTEVTSSTTDLPKSFNLQSVEASAEKVKTFQLTWNKSQGATSYQVCLKNISKPDNCETISPPISTNQTEITLDKTLLSDQLNFFIMASNTKGKAFSNEKTPDSATIVAAIGYYKASNTEQSDYFGTSVSLSADGNTLAVGAPYEDSLATGINGNQSDNSASNTGAVYIFTRTGGKWTQQAYVKASNTDHDDSFGASVSLSADGNTLAVGAPGEASLFSNNQQNNFAHGAGAVYVFSRADGEWTQQAYVKASNTDPEDFFGFSVSLSADGNTLAVGAAFEDSKATGIDGNQSDNSASHSGAVYIFSRTGGEWTQQAYVKASNTDQEDYFGISVSLSADGNTLAVGATDEDSEATEIDGNQLDNSASNSGAVYVFARAGGEWAQQAYVKASNAEQGDSFGASVSLSADGNSLAVGAWGEDTQATGIDGNQADNRASDSGAVYIFARTDGEWAQQAYIKASNTETNDEFGNFVSLSADGNTLAVGARGEDSLATGIGGNQADTRASYSGAVYMFARTDREWAQQAYVKASNTNQGDGFGSTVSLSADGNTLAVGAWQENSQSTGIGGNQADNGAEDSGAVYIY